MVSFRWLFALVLGTILITSTSSLSCWICTSLIDESCGEDDIQGIIPGKIMRSDCKYVQSTSTSGKVGPRIIPATTCLRQVIKSTGQPTLVVRSCASPGDMGIQDATAAKCNRIASPDGDASVETCLCQGDFCNGPVKSSDDLPNVSGTRELVKPPSGLETPSTPSGLRCWICTSQKDKRCSENGIPKEGIPGLIYKSDCSEIPSPTVSDILLERRTVPATTCSKSITKIEGKDDLVIRTCASPGDPGISDATVAKCETLKSKPERKPEETLMCLCKGNYCNGSENLNLKFKSTFVISVVPLGYLLARLP